MSPAVVYVFYFTGGRGSNLRPVIGPFSYTTMACPTKIANNNMYFVFFLYI
jgi:hypothetical protein